MHTTITDALASAATFSRSRQITRKVPARDIAYLRASSRLAQPLTVLPIATGVIR